MASPDEGYVPPTWAYSAVCPNGYDYAEPWCKLRGATGAAPQWPEALPHGPFNEATMQSAHQAEVANGRIEMAAISAGLALTIASLAFLSTYLKGRKGAK